MDQDRPLQHDRLMVDVSLLLVRIVVGLIFAMHGSQKLLGTFGGPGLAQTVENFGGGILGYLVTIGEFFGGLGLIVGFLTRFSAAALIVIMIGAIIRVHSQSFFLHHDGFEYNLALIGLLLPILLSGPGRFSIGRFLPFPKSAGTGRPFIAIE